MGSAGKLLVRAAEIAENQQNYEYELRERGGNMHPIRALYLASNCTKGSTFDTALRRLFDCCGVDFMDHTQAENIDDLVAAAFWQEG